MSSPLAVAAVTAVLRDLLNNGLIDHDVTGATGGNVTVTALAPDRLFPGGATETDQLNLFLHQVTPNTGWSNQGLPSHDHRGQRLTNAPLALDLHYLLTAYGASDLHAEILLGYGMHVLHETPVLTPAAIRRALAAPGAPVNGSILPPALQAVSASDLADQVEQIRITPTALGSEEMSKLWSALQSSYRPTAAYHVSVVLIEAAEAARSPLPVLTRGTLDPVTGRDRGPVVQPSLVPPYPTLDRVKPPNMQIAVRMGEDLGLEGHHLDATQVRARFMHQRTLEQLELPANAGGNRLGFAASLPQDPEPPAGPFPPNDPMDPDNWQIGVYTVAGVMQDPGSPERVSNELPVVLAPTIVSPPIQVVANAATGITTFTVSCSPKVRQGQSALLLVRDFAISADPITTADTRTLTFQAETDQLPPAGQHPVRLQVDGVSSILIDRSQMRETPDGRILGHPRFDPTQVVTI